MPTIFANRLARYQSRAEAAPTRETELIELNRDYDDAATAVRRLLEEEPGIADGRGARDTADWRAVPSARAGARARAAGEPESSAAQPSRRVWAASRSASASSPWREYRDTTFKTDDDVMASLALPVLAMIPNMVTRTERRHRRRRRVMMSVTAVLVALAVAATTVWFVWRA